MTAKVPASAPYPRSARTPRGQARKAELLEAVVADLMANGLVDFSLRRAARAAGTTHKVLLYHFDGVDDLLAHAVPRLRELRIENALRSAGRRKRLSDRMLAIWPVLVGEESRVLDQAIGLVLYDTDRYSYLAEGVSARYLAALVSLCPPQWSHRRKSEVAELVLGAMRGFLIGRLTSPDDRGVRAGLRALARALDREETIV